MQEHGYLEMDVPLLVPSAAMEPALHPYAVGQAFLHTSPEFALKKVLACGLPRVYSLGPCFRDEEAGPHHAPEFTMLEWYRVGVGYEEIMAEVESLLSTVCASVDRVFPTLPHLDWEETYTRYCGPPPADSEERTRLWLQEVEPHLPSPCIVRDYPADQAAFAAVRGECAERFELYWEGLELANAFTELLEADTLRSRWEAGNLVRTAEGRQPHPLDADLLEAVARHPRAGGIALGVDRLVMILLEKENIADVRIPGANPRG